MFLSPKVFEQIAKHHSFRQEERESRSFIIYIKQIKLAAELTVVAFFSLFNPLKICCKLILFRESYTVNALKHLILTVAFPVSSGTLEKLERFNSTRRKKMRSCTQIDKFSHFVERDIFSLRHASDKHYLIGLSFLFHQLYCLVPRKYKTLHLCVFFNDLLHLFFDLFYNVGSERYLRVDIIIKTVIY